MKKLIVLSITSFILSACAVGISTRGHGPVAVVTPAPPAIMVKERPRLVFSTDYNIYFAPDLKVDLYFDQGIWFYFYEGVWYKGSDYRGPWTAVKVKHLPHGLKTVPPGYLKKLHQEKEAKGKSKNKEKGPK